jgi:hypothetical protein
MGHSLQLVVAAFAVASLVIVKRYQGDRRVLQATAAIAIGLLMLVTSRNFILRGALSAVICGVLLAAAAWLVNEISEHDLSGTFALAFIVRSFVFFATALAAKWLEFRWVFGAGVVLFGAAAVCFFLDGPEGKGSAVVRSTRAQQQAVAVGVLWASVQLVDFRFASSEGRVLNAAIVQLVLGAALAISVVVTGPRTVASMSRPQERDSAKSLAGPVALTLGLLAASTWMNSYILSTLTRRSSIDLGREIGKGLFFAPTATVAAALLLGAAVFRERMTALRIAGLVLTAAASAALIFGLR